MVTFYADKELKRRTERALAYENARNGSQSNEIDTSIAETMKVVRYTMDVTGVLRGQSKAVCNKDNSNALQKLLRDLKAEEDSEEGSERGSEEGSGKKSDAEGSEVESNKEFRKAALAIRAQDLLSGVWAEAVALEYDGGWSVKELLEPRQGTSIDEGNKTSPVDGGSAGDADADRPRDQEVSIDPESIGGLTLKNGHERSDHINEKDTDVGRERGREEIDYGGGSDMTSDGWVPGFSPREMAKRYGDVGTGWPKRDGQTSAGSGSAGSASGTEFGQNGKGQWEQAPADTLQSANGSWVQASIL